MAARDIFSLGVVFYELLTGRRPFQRRLQGRNCWSRSRSSSPSAPADRRHHPQGTGTHLPEGAVQAGLGAVHDGQGHGRRPAAFPGRAAVGRAAGLRARRRSAERSRHVATPSHQPNADSAPISRPSDFRQPAHQDRAERACVPLMHTMPTSSLNCCPALVTEKGCPTAFASGRPASRRRTPTTPSPWA